MTTQMTIRFSKLDMYNNAVFIAGVEDTESYAMLSKFNDSLIKMNTETFLPVYKSEKYATIRFKSNTTFKFSEGSTYIIKFDIRKKINKEKTYIICYLSSSKLAIKAPPKDLGEILTFD